jgi:hypothetical protein
MVDLRISKIFFYKKKNKKFLIPYHILNYYKISNFLLKFYLIEK